jgi:hypothetical protein
MSAFEYLTVNSLTSYPFRDARGEHTTFPIEPDVFLDILFVAKDRNILRPYISRIQAAANELNLFFNDAATGNYLFTASIPSGDVLDHLINTTASFYGISNSLASVKFVFGAGMPKLYALGNDVPYTPEFTELSPGAVVYSVPKVTSLDYETYIYTNPGVDLNQALASVKIYHEGDEARIDAGSNSQFAYEAPSTKYIDIGRGLGTGLHDPCDGGIITDVLTINRVGPDKNGNVFINSTECYSSKLLTENERILLTISQPEYLTFALPFQTPNTFDVLAPAFASHGLIFENFCKPKCPPENLNAFAEYLNRVKDGASELYKLVNNSQETRGMCEFQGSAGDKLVANSFCNTSTILDNSIACSSGFIKYFHEGRQVRIFYGMGVYHTYTIKEVLNSSEVVLTVSPLPVPAGKTEVDFKILDLGFVDNLNNSIAAYNFKTSKYDEPYIESNYTTVDAYYTLGRYGTFITSTTVVYNPGKSPISFVASFNEIVDISVGSVVETIAESIKIKKSDGDILYGATASSIDCKDYAIVDAIFFIPCGGIKGKIEVSIQDATTHTDFVSSPVELAATSAACVQTTLAAKTVTALEGVTFNYAFAITGATSYTLTGSKPSWLQEDLLTTATSNIFGTPSGPANSSYVLHVEAQTTGSSFIQQVTVKYIAKPVMAPALSSTNIDVYFPDISARTYIGSSPLLTLSATNFPTSYSAFNLPPGLRMYQNKVVGKFIISSADVYPKTYNVDFWASNTAGSGTSIPVTLTLLKELVALPARQGQPYCFNLPAEASRLGEDVLSGAPSWLSFKPTALLTAGDCNFSGTPSGSVSSTSTIVIKYDYADTYKTLNVSLAYSANSNITYPVTNTTIDIYHPDYAVSGGGRTWTLTDPLLTVTATNNPTSFTATGLPAGLSIDSSGKIIGTLTGAPGVSTCSLVASTAIGAGSPVIVNFRVHDSAVVIPATQEGSSVCYKLVDIGGAQSLALVPLPGNPSWLAFSSGLSSICNLSGNTSGGLSAALALYCDINFNGGNTRRKLTLDYTAKPRILTPALNQRIAVIDANYSSLTFNASFPLLDVTASNLPTSFTLAGQPSGLSIDSSGKVIGTLTAGLYNVTATATNSAGSGSINFEIFVSSAPSTEQVLEGQNYCYHVPPDTVPTSHFTVAGVLPSWLSFDGLTTSSCNFSATSVAQTTSQFFNNIVISKHRADGSGATTLGYALNYIAKPRVTYPAANTVFEITPPDFNSTVFTSSDPLFTVQASNSPSSFTATGFPSNTLRIDSSGRIIGLTGNVAINAPIKITLQAHNTAGSSTPVDVYFKIRTTPITVTVTRTSPLCEVINKADLPTSLSLTSPVSWISINSNTSSLCGLTGSIPLGDSVSTSYNLTLVRNYMGGKLNETIIVNAILPPVITSPSLGATPATRNVYTIAPPDYLARTYAVASPLLTVTATNNPTSFTATGLPAGLSIDSSGRVIGGPVSVSPGIYSVQVYGTNAGGAGSPVTFDIEITNTRYLVETYTGRSECFKITTADKATNYSLNSSLPLNLIFDGSPAATCNISGSFPAGSGDLFKSYQLTRTYLGGSSRCYIDLRNFSVPVITSPAKDDVLVFPPTSYLGTTYSVSNPLFVVVATNNPTSFTATGLPTGLSIDSSGKVTGQTTGPASLYAVSLKAINAAGTGITVNIKLDLNKIIPVLTWATPASIPYYQALTLTQLNAQVSPILAGTFTYTPALGAVIGSTGSKTLSVLFSPTDSTNYATATAQVQIVLNVGAPVITSPSLGATPATRNVYTIAPPDYAGRVYTTAAPLLTVTASNTPSGFTATGLPAGLSIDSSGRVIGGPVSVSPGIYSVQVYGTNSTGPGAPATFDIEVKNVVPVLNTFVSDYLCVVFDTLDGATKYELVAGSALFAGLTFNQSISAACNISGTPSSVVATQLATLTIRSVYVGGSSSATLKLDHLALPQITSLTANQIIKKSPSAFLGITFDASNPLFTIVSTNNPDGYNYYNFPPDLYIDPDGNVVGDLWATDAFSRTITIAPYNDSGEGASVSIILDLSKQDTSLVWNTPSSIVYGTGLSATQLSAYESSSVPGTISYSCAGVPVTIGSVLTAGNKTLLATFTPTNANGANPSTKSVVLNVTKATPTLTWLTPAAIVYGTALSSSQLNASCAASGSYSYSPISGTILSAGTTQLTVTFVPADSANLATSTKTVNIVVTKATPVLVWGDPANISYGSVLTSTQLNAVAKASSSSSAPVLNGTFTYTPPINTALAAGSYTLTTSFVIDSAGSANYTSSAVIETAALQVDPAFIPIVWSPTSTLIFGGALDSNYLNASITVSNVTKIYTPVQGTLLGVGSATLSLTATTTDANYRSTTVTRNITVIKASRTASITSAATAAVGDTFSLVSSVTGEATTLTYTSSNTTILSITGNSATVLKAGTAVITVVAAESSSYFSATSSQIFTATKGTSSVTITSGTTVYVGSSIILTSNVTNSTGALTYTSSNPAVGVINNNSSFFGVSAGICSVTVTLAADSNYLSSTATKAIAVAKSVSTISSTLSAAYTTGTTALLGVTTTGSTANWSCITSNAAVATVDLTARTVTFLSAGSVTFTFSLPADANYLAASTTKTITVT